MNIVDYLPGWSKRVATEGGGRDPLGLSRVSFILTDYLLTGIITTTDRARYYSFYTWVLWHIQQEENPTDYLEFVDSFRRREAAMALATMSVSPELTPVGYYAVKDQLDRGKQIGEYDCNFKVMPSSRLGGYSQYYASSIYHLKLSRGDELGIHYPSDDIGTQVAIAFHESIQDTGYVRNSRFRTSKLPEGDLRELSDGFVLDFVRTAPAAKERNHLIDVFFGLTEKYQDRASLMRRQTLTILLDLVEHYEVAGIVPVANRGDVLDEYLLYAIYYRVLNTTDDRQIAINEIPGHQTAYLLWQQFCLHEFMIQALENLLFGVIETVGEEDAGLSLDLTVERLLQKPFFDELMTFTGERCNSPSELLAAIGVEELPNHESSHVAQETFGPSVLHSEANIVVEPVLQAGEAAARSVLLLGILFAKWRGCLNEAGMQYLKKNTGSEVWAGTVLPFLDPWLDRDSTWSESLSSLMVNFILDRHDRVLYEKGRLDGWIHRSDGRILKDQDYQPQWRASRFINATRIMRDLCLVETNSDSELTITEDGKALLKRLKSSVA